MKRLLVTVLMFVCFATTAHERYYFSNLSLKEGLSQISVLSIFQDSRGYMWFGTRNGLNRYNGYEFEIYNYSSVNENSLSDGHIHAIAEDGDENLWVGTNNGLNRLNMKTGKITRYFSEQDNQSSLSANTVSSLLFDSNGRLWVGTNSGLNLYLPETDSFERILLDGVLSGNRIYTIFGNNGKVYLGTASRGLAVFDYDSGDYQVFSHDESNPNSIAHNSIRAILIDKNDNLWVGTHHAGISLRRKGSENFETINTASGLTNNYVRCIVQSPQGDILIGTFNGLNVLDDETHQIEHYNTYDYGHGDLSHYSIFSVFLDNVNTLWVGTYAGGVNYSNQYLNRFRFYDPSTHLGMVLGVIGPMVEWGDFLYIATEGGGLLEYNRVNSSWAKYEPVKVEEEYYLLNTNNIFKSLYVHNGQVLCGTYAGKIYSFNPKNKRFSLFFDNKEENPIYGINYTSKGEMIICAVGSRGLTIVSKNGKAQHLFPVKGESERNFSNTRCCIELQNNVLLIGTRNAGLYIYDRDTHQLKNYNQNNSDLPENYISAILRDEDGKIWIGTFGGGIALFNPGDGSFEVFDSADGLHDNHVCSLVQQNENALWISTISGITKFETNYKTFVNYSHDNGIRVAEFTPHAGAILSDGTAIFSGNNGLIMFNPDRLYPNPFTPPIRLHNLFVNNVQIEPFDDTGVLDMPLENKKSIKLRYNQSNFAIGYSALNYIFPEKNQYSYILEGLDDEWNEVGSRTIAYYTNLSPGEYLFKVKGSNNDGVWNNDPVTLKISVLPPFWKSWWAYLIYIIILLTVLRYILGYFIERRRHENELKLKQAEAAAQEEYHQAQNRLFTNFSHELRTPLTLIMAPLEEMIEKQRSLNEEPDLSLEMMKDNTSRLMRLVNNLMDFQKGAKGKLQLRCKRGDFIGFVDNMVSAFSELSLRRNIALNYSHNVDTLDYSFDYALMERVFFNLLSNAFKNTDNEGEVDVVVKLTTNEELSAVQLSKLEQAKQSSTNSYILVKVRDTGVGIAEEETEKIFAPFYQVAQNEHSASGTGLGLSLSRSIVEMHGGVMWAERAELQGSLFSFILPLNLQMDETEKANQEEEDKFSEQKETSTFYDQKESESAKEEKEDSDAEEISQQRYTVLVAEDNADLRHYIVSRLECDYTVIQAKNGAELLDKAILHMPDIIVTDLMMPVMDGVQATKKLKEDLRTSHIPVIMLTALATDSDKKEGYDIGADAYITKPFSASVLISRVGNILRSREALKELYGKQFSLETFGVKATSIDEQFMNKLYSFLEEKMSDPQLNLDTIAKHVGLSRSNLYRKMKSITGLSPSEFLRNVRLEAGAKLLRESDLTVSEVYVAVGFNSHAYFSNSFRDYFGLSPTEYIAKKND